MKWINSIILISFILGQQVYAQTMVAKSEKSCIEEAQKVGNGEGKDNVSLECVASFKAKAKELGIQKKTSSGEEVYAYKNIIFLESVSGMVTFSGKSTYLNDVQSVIFDEVNKEIIVLDKQNGILTFSSTLPGNVTPKRVIPASLLKSVTSMGLDLKNDEIVVYSSLYKKASIFSRQANGRGKKSEQRLEIKKNIHNVNSYAPTSSKGEYAFYDEFGTLIGPEKP